MKTATSQRKRLFVLAALLAAAAGTALFSAQTSPTSFAPGRIREGLSLKSAVMGRNVNYAVYLPPDYAASERRYPVVYLLHGYSDDESGWVQFGEIKEAADRAIAERLIPPMIIVMPDGGVTWYVNDIEGKARFDDCFVQEFIPHIDATFRTRPKKEFRGIAGLSMGGWGALTNAMRHRELFAACAAYSAAVWTEEEIVKTPDDRYDRMFGPLFGPRPEGKASETFHKLNPLSLAQTLPVDELRKVRYYIDCGDDDFLIAGNMALHQAMLERKISHEFRVRDGGHSWSYWRTGIIDGLAFIGQSFHR
ncbi:MAG: esterase family protein [Candidatus Aminicenantes bacterium]|nr:esterase family protein [Candidatus Aminicenantes bacterium]